jgi:hypothetical protein
MFKVYFAPFNRNLMIPQTAYFALVYEGKRKSRFFIACISNDPEKRAQFTEQYEIIAECLNEIKSFSFTREMLRSIQYSIQHEKERLRLSRIQNRKIIFNRADFGRLDFDRPGIGGSGVDGYW